MENVLELTNSNLLCDDFSGFTGFGSIKPPYDPAKPETKPKTPFGFQSKPRMFGSTNSGSNIPPTTPIMQLNGDNPKQSALMAVKGRGDTPPTSITLQGKGDNPKQVDVLSEIEVKGEPKKETVSSEPKKEGDVKNTEPTKETTSTNKQQDKLSDEEKSGYVLGMKPIVLYSIVGVLLIGGSFAAYKLFKK